MVFLPGLFSEIIKYPADTEKSASIKDFVMQHEAAEKSSSKWRVNYLRILHNYKNADVKLVYSKSA